MTEDQRVLLSEELDRDEGREKMPYIDTVGKVTIGVGRNLTDRGLSDDEIDYLLQNDIDTAIDDLNRGIPWWDTLTPVRQRVLVNMCFNLGWPKLKGFVRTLAAVRRGDYAAAAQGMRESLWARQVGARAERLAQMMERGQ